MMLRILHVFVHNVFMIFFDEVSFAVLPIITYCLQANIRNAFPAGLVKYSGLNLLLEGYE